MVTAWPSRSSSSGRRSSALTLGRDPDTTKRLEAAFGANARSRIIARLRRPDVATSPSAEELLAQAADDTNEAILAVLAAHIALDDGAKPTDARPDAAEPTPEGPLYAPGALLRAVRPDPEVIGRDEAVTEILELIGRRDPAVPLVVAQAGAGRTALGGAIAARLAAPGYAGPLAGRPVVRPDLASVFSGSTIEAFDKALDAVPEGAIAFLDGVETFAAIGIGADPALTWIVVRLRGAMADPRFRMVLTVDEAFAARLTANEGLAAELRTVHLEPLSAEDVRTIAVRHAADLSRHHKVSISPEMCELAASRPAKARAHPALAVELLDGACARAALRADRTVREKDLGGSPAVAKATVDPVGLAAVLRERIRGQDHVIDAVVSRLTITRAQFDLRPERPDGVFLFVGPTGVGKTELARALCASVHGAEDDAHLIRLDMSEFSDEYTISRLIGPAPGYVGFTEPESWLTTRVRDHPDCVVLLDEIEKAHPKIWNAFLQVFDAGRLADGRGTVADFSKAIVIMTSNLGAHASRGRRAPIGFVTDASAEPEDDGEASMMDAVRAAMPPEFVNRMDDVITFAPLDPATIADIARKEVGRAKAMLEQRGYRVEIDEAVIELIGATGYDPAYGARHLQRNLEALLLTPIARAGARALHAYVENGRVVVAAPDAAPAG
jgi:ATP-dependent Clp protease ATP-binding subunit ClpA